MSNPTGKVISISNKLDREPHFIEIDEKLYKVDTSKNAVLRFFELQKKSEAGEVTDVEVIDRAIKLFLGNEAFKEIEEKNAEFSFENWKVIYLACLSSAMNKTYEEMEESFRNFSN